MAVVVLAELVGPLGRDEGPLVHALGPGSALDEAVAAHDAAVHFARATAVWEQRACWGRCVYGCSAHLWYLMMDYIRWNSVYIEYTCSIFE